MTMGGTELDRLLRDVADTLAAACACQPLDRQALSVAGAAFVRLRIPVEDLLSGSLPLLAELPAAVRTDMGAGDSDQDRLRAAELTTAFTTGIVLAMKDRVLSEQQSIQRAAGHALVEAQRGRLDSQRRLQAVFDAAAIAIAICDLDGRIVEANQGLANMIGTEPAMLAGRCVPDLLHPDDRNPTRADIRRVLASGDQPVRVQRRLNRTETGTKWVMLSLSVVAASEGGHSYLVVVGEDITERHYLQQTLEHQARHDALTGLPNRTLLHLQLRATLQNAAPDSQVGLCFIDLDEFKVVNDTLGHRTGDQLLIAVAQRLYTICGTEHFVARVGGDEFVVIIPSSPGKAGLSAFADRILAALSRPIDVDGYRLAISASIGIIEQTAATANPEQMLRDATPRCIWPKPTAAADGACSTPIATLNSCSDTNCRRSFPRRCGATSSTCSTSRW
jgi:diguanylate cyclase (GGDEF)-like protein/PAS domain S-box-containing protein